MTRIRTRPGFTLSQLIVLLAVLALFLGFMLSALSRVRNAASRASSQNNIKQILLGTLNKVDTDNGILPAGCDENNFSALTHILPYIEQDNLYKKLDLKQSIDAEANAEIRKTAIRTYMSPTDNLMKVNDFASTSYQFSILSFPHLKGSRFPATFTDGTSNTVFVGETLLGDGNNRGLDVRRQHVALTEEQAKKFKDDKRDDMGVEDFKQGKNVVGDRGASWMDGRFLQATFGTGRTPNDKRPDVAIKRKGGAFDGLSGPRSLDKMIVNVGLGDGSVRSVADSISKETWNAALTPNGGEVLGNDW